LLQLSRANYLLARPTAVMQRLHRHLHASGFTVTSWYLPANIRFPNCSLSYLFLKDWSPLPGVCWYSGLHLMSTCLFCLHRQPAQEARYFLNTFSLFVTFTCWPFTYILKC